MAFCGDKAATCAQASAAMGVAGDTSGDSESHRMSRAVSHSGQRQFPNAETGAFQNGKDTAAGLISADNEELSWG